MGEKLQKNRITDHIMMKTAVLSFLFIACSLASPPPPNTKQNGHRYSGSGNSVVRLQAMMDHLCPDSKASWPVLKDVAEKYGEKLEITIHMFPLPYHHNSYLSTWGEHIITASEGEAQWWKWF